MRRLLEFFHDLQAPIRIFKAPIGSSSSNSNLQGSSRSPSRSNSTPRVSTLHSLSLSLSGKLKEKAKGEQNGRRGYGGCLNRIEGGLFHSQSENMKGLKSINELIKLNKRVNNLGNTSE